MLSVGLTQCETDGSSESIEFSVEHVFENMAQITVRIVKVAVNETIRGGLVGRIIKATDKRVDRPRHFAKLVGHQLHLEAIFVFGVNLICADRDWCSIRGDPHGFRRRWACFRFDDRLHDSGIAVQNLVDDDDKRQKILGSAAAVTRYQSVESNIGLLRCGESLVNFDGSIMSLGRAEG